MTSSCSPAGERVVAQATFSPVAQDPRERVSGGGDALRRARAAGTGVGEFVGRDHPLAVELRRLVQIAVEGERLRANLGAFGIDQLEQILLKRGRL